jgi:hypothetical protein
MCRHKDCYVRAVVPAATAAITVVGAAAAVIHASLDWNCCCHLPSRESEREGRERELEKRMKKMACQFALLACLLLLLHASMGKCESFALK